MTTTKPPRTRTATRQAPRQAPTYRRLKADEYAMLDQHEQHRHDAHLDLDAVFDAVQYAELDRRSHGWPSDRRLSDAPRHSDEESLNAVEAWSQQPDPASDWLAEYAEMRGLILRVARLARYHFGFDPERGQTTGTEDRQNMVAVCVWCLEPAPSGRDEAGRPMVRMVDGKIPLHTSPCYETAAKQAQRAGLGVLAHVQHVQRTKSAS